MERGVFYIDKKEKMPQFVHKNPFSDKTLSTAVFDNFSLSLSNDYCWIRSCFFALLIVDIVYLYVLFVDDRLWRTYLFVESLVYLRYLEDCLLRIVFIV